MEPITINVKINIQNRLEKLPEKKQCKHVLKANRAAQKIMTANEAKQKIVKINTIGLSKKLVSHLIKGILPHIAMRIVSLIPGILAIVL